MGAYLQMKINKKTQMCGGEKLKKCEVIGWQFVRGKSGAQEMTGTRWKAVGAGTTLRGCRWRGTHQGAPCFGQRQEGRRVLR